MSHTPFTAPNGDTDWPSVTQVGDVLAKPSLYKWFAEQGLENAERIKVEAGAIGTDYHTGIYHRFNGTVPTAPISAQAQGMVDKFFEEFVKPYKVEPESLEKKVYNEEFRTHGTYDGIVKVHDVPIGRARIKYTGRVLADWKQSNGIYDSHGLQLGGYWLCLPNAPTDGLVVQINRESLDIRKKMFFDLRCYAEEFKACRDIWDYVNRKGAWAR